MINLKQTAFVGLISLVMFSCSKGEKKVVASYEDGKPFIVEYLKTKDGKKIKTYEEHFYRNGNLRLKGKYSNKNKNGVWKYYFDDGTLFAEADYSKNKNGDNWQIHLDKDSILVNKQDKILAIAFSSEGTPVSVRIKKDDKGEIFYRFFNSFKIMERVFLKGNIPQGEAMSWHENGNINSIHYYADGMQDSIYTVYADNGQKIISGKFNKGSKVGKWEYFSSKGKPLGYEIYDYDGTKLSKQDNQGLIYSTTPPSKRKKSIMK